jgi:hypothetical protein
MKPKYHLEPSYTAIFLSRKDWIRGPKAPVDIPVLVWFTDGCGTEDGTQAEICGPRTRVFFSVGKEVCKIRLWRGCSFTEDFGRHV